MSLTRKMRQARKMRRKSSRRKRFQLISVPALGERKAAAIDATSEDLAKMVSAARWAAMLDEGFGRLYRVRDRLSRKIVFEIDVSRADFDALVTLLYGEHLGPRPVGIEVQLEGETLYEAYEEAEEASSPSTQQAA